MGKPLGENGGNRTRRTEPLRWVVAFGLTHPTREEAGRSGSEAGSIREMKSVKTKPTGAHACHPVVGLVEQIAGLGAVDLMVAGQTVRGIRESAPCCCRLLFDSSYPFVGSGPGRGTGGREFRKLPGSQGSWLSRSLYQGAQCEGRRSERPFRSVVPVCGPEQECEFQARPGVAATDTAS
jgi:hypothetical protein